MTIEPKWRCALRALGWGAAFAYAVGLVAPDETSAQTRFGVEVAAGRNIGFVPYIDNVVVLQGNRTALADEALGSGSAGVVRFLFEELEAGLGVRLFDRDTLIIHHLGDTELPEHRQRADGSIDDAGVVYSEVDRVRIASPASRPGDLFMFDLGAGWRYYVLSGAFSLYVPLAGAVVGMKVLEANRPLILGVDASTGVGLELSVAKPVRLFLAARAHGLITPTYHPMADAARTSHATQEGTEDAVLGATAFGTVLLGLQLVIR